MKATQRNGTLTELNNSSNENIADCYIDIVEFDKKIYMNVLPEISDGKGAQYSDESAIGRSMPFKSYQWSENRAITWTMHLITTKQSDVDTNINNMRALEACVYPLDEVENVPYSPPPILKIKCGKLLGDDELCVVMKSYSVKFDTTVPWDASTLLPYKLDIDMQFEVVYNQSELPGAEKIFKYGK